MAGCLRFVIAQGGHQAGEMPSNAAMEHRASIGGSGKKKSLEPNGAGDKASRREAWTVTARVGVKR